MSEGNRWAAKDDTGDVYCLKAATCSPSDLRLVKTTGQHILFHFMCRWTCSRCWKTAVALNRLCRYFEQYNVAIVLVGTSHYLQQATHLAAEFRLSFTLLADDSGVLRQAYGFSEGGAGCHDQAIVLVDAYGAARYRRFDLASKSTFKVADLFTCLDNLGGGTGYLNAPLAC